MSSQLNRSDYVGWLIEQMNKALDIDPSDVLQNHTSHNYSGGKRGWEPEAHEVYTNPQTLEEGLLALRLYELLLIALKNAKRQVLKNKENDDLWHHMDLGEVYRLGELISHRNAILAVETRIWLNGQLQHTRLHTLDDAIRAGFGGVMYCAR